MNGADWRCRACGSVVPIADPSPWRCPGATAADRHHVLMRAAPITPLREQVDSLNPLLAYRSHLAWDAFAAARGLGEHERVEIIQTFDAAVSAVDGRGFRMTPFSRHHELSRHLGFAEFGGVWVKDETGGVAGSHKARHLASTMLYLLTAERLGLRTDRPALAIASCGNAAIAAATLAAAVRWPIQVFVPAWASGAVLDRLTVLGADVVRCTRVSGDPPGDPCVHRFRAAVAAGAIPFSVQGPENATCLDSGRAIGFEMARQLETSGGPALDRLFVQVGDGALLSCAASGFFASGLRPCVHAVQTAGCAPLARAWERAAGIPSGDLAGRWADLMWPWEPEPQSMADGILDDETFDWLGAFDGMRGGGGSPIVTDEATVIEAHSTARQVTGIHASPTGTAGFAGLLTIRDRIGDNERVAVILSGVQR